MSTLSLETRFPPTLQLHQDPVTLGSQMLQVAGKIAAFMITTALFTLLLTSGGGYALTTAIIIATGVNTTTMTIDEISQRYFFPPYDENQILMEKDFDPILERLTDFVNAQKEKITKDQIIKWLAVPIPFFGGFFISSSPLQEDSSFLETVTDSVLRERIINVQKLIQKHKSEETPVSEKEIKQIERDIENYQNYIDNEEESSSFADTILSQTFPNQNSLIDFEPEQKHGLFQAAFKDLDALKEIEDEDIRSVIGFIHRILTNHITGDRTFSFQQISNINQKLRKLLKLKDPQNREKILQKESDKLASLMTRQNRVMSQEAFDEVSFQKFLKETNTKEVHFKTLEKELQNIKNRIIQKLQVPENKEEEKTERLVKNLIDSIITIFGNGNEVLDKGNEACIAFLFEPLRQILEAEEFDAEKAIETLEDFPLDTVKVIYKLKTLYNDNTALTTKQLEKIQELQEQVEWDVSLREGYLAAFISCVKDICQAVMQAIQEIGRSKLFFLPSFVSLQKIKEDKSLHNRALLLKIMKSLVEMIVLTKFVIPVIIIAVFNLLINYFDAKVEKQFILQGV